MSRSISLLLGAGFSAPMGYPVGNDLNKKLLALDGTEFGFHTNGMLVFDSKTGRKPDRGFETNGEKTFRFCRELMKYFNEEHRYFDYEEFYDFLNYDAAEDEKVIEIFKPYRSDELDEKSWKKREDADGSELNGMLSKVKTVYQQLVPHFLEDREGRRYYEEESFVCGPYFPGYTGVLNCLRTFVEEGVVNIHTLNHDLLLERLENTEWLTEKVSDGFEERGSPYYADLAGDGRYSVRLERYTENYNKPCRLFKLHGSIDYHYFSAANNADSVFYPKKYIKLKSKIDRDQLKKEIVNNDGNPEYQYAPPGYYHPDFLTGTTSKIFRYDEPLLYKILFGHFQKNLRHAEKLIIIGYGGRDEKVNEIILENFDYQNKPSYIIDPYAGEEIRKFGEKLGATLLPPEKTVETVTIQDLQ